MSLHFTPEEHDANPPESWVVVKVFERTWELRHAGGTSPLQTFGTKYEAETARLTGWLVDLYDKEGRWFAGDPVAGWRPYVERVDPGELAFDVDEADYLAMIL